MSSKKEFIVLDHEPLAHGYLKFARLRLQHSRYDGTMSPPVSRERLEHPGAVVVVLEHPSSDQLIFVEQFRVGACGDLPEPWLLECVAGVLDPAEDPSETAQREVREETGVEPIDLQFLSKVYASPGCSNECFYIFQSKINELPPQSYGGLASEDEDLRIVALSRKEAYARLDRGLWMSAPTALALFYARTRTA